MLRKSNIQRTQTPSDKIIVTKIKNSTERPESKVKEVAQNIERKDQEVKDMGEKTRRWELPVGTTPTNAPRRENGREERNENF